MKSSLKNTEFTERKRLLPYSVYKKSIIGIKCGIETEPNYHIVCGFKDENLAIEYANYLQKKTKIEHVIEYKEFEL